MLIKQPFDFDLTQYVTDPENDPLTFIKLAGPGWLRVSAGGQITGTPQESDLGKFTARFEVNDGVNRVAVDAFGEVIKKIVQPPSWKEDPIRFTAFVNQPFNETLVDKVDNPSGRTLTFTKQSGAAWLNVGSAGGISGKPGDLDVGQNNFRVTVRHNASNDIPVMVIIDVKKKGGPIQDDIRVDEPVPGARVDNLWVVDNSEACNGYKCLMPQLEKNIDVYFNALDKAKIHYLGMYMAGDQCNYPNPITDKKKRLLFSWEFNDNAKSFEQRMEKAEGDRYWNSPLVAMTRFFRIKPSDFPAPFFEPKVPMETMLITSHPDQYKRYQTKGSSIRGWDPDDFADHYIDLLDKAKKPLRVSAIAPKCPKTSYPTTGYHRNDTCRTTSGSGENAYQVIVRRTKGKYYTYFNGAKVRAFLEDYADEVIFRAYVTAKKRIKLSQTPADPSKIEVFLAGKKLTSGWRYDSGTNEIVFDWDKIDISGLKPGDRIEIRYTVNASRPVIRT